MLFTMRITWGINICCLHIMLGILMFTQLPQNNKGEHTSTTLRSWEFIGSWRYTVLVKFLLSLLRYHNAVSCVNLSWGSIAQYLQQNTTIQHTTHSDRVLWILCYNPYARPNPMRFSYRLIRGTADARLTLEQVVTYGGTKWSYDSVASSFSSGSCCSSVRLIKSWNKTLYRGTKQEGTTSSSNWRVHDMEWGRK
jgi:hypothetical protein